MSNPLRALLPVHALRESRALRQCHERDQALGMALQAEADANAQQRRLHRESNETLARLADAGPMRAADAHWALHEAADSRQRAQACEATLPGLASQAAAARDAVREARTAHAARVRSHHKVREASRQVGLRQERAQDSLQEQRADDDFAPRWFKAQRVARGR